MLSKSIFENTRFRLRYIFYSTFAIDIDLLFDITILDVFTSKMFVKKSKKKKKQHKKIVTNFVTIYSKNKSLIFLDKF